MQLEELTVYQLAMEIGQKIWVTVSEWDYFEKSSIGKQLLPAADSIAANLSEGFGRYYYKENKQFSYYSRGSLSETKTWLTKAHQRKLIKAADFNALNKEIELLGLKLNHYINSIGSPPKPQPPLQTKNPMTQ